MNYMECRICFVKTGTVSIFEIDTDNVQYSAKMMRLINSNVHKDEGLPSMMCGCCTKKLSSAYQFIQKCETADKVLKFFTASNVYTKSHYLDKPTTVNIKTDGKHELESNNQDDSCSYILLDICASNYFQQDSNITNEQIDGEQTHKTESAQKQDFELTKNDLIQYDKSTEMCKYIEDKASRKEVGGAESGPIQCVVCGIIKVSLSAMKIHMQTHTGEKPFQCTKCNAKYVSKGLFNRHIEIFHSTRERKFICETCGSRFFRKNDIIIHLQVHIDQKPYVCQNCNKQFKQIASLNRHQVIHSGKKPFSCEICNKRFAYKALVKKHQTVHTDEKKYTCHLCNKSVKSREALNVHISLHSNEKNNVCSFCGLAFAKKGNLTTHIKRIHSEKSGLCSVCLKTCSNLEVHLRQHTGEKPFVCGVCNVAFTLKRSLAHHMIFKHDNASKFKCSMIDCTKAFPTGTMLEFHLMKQHTNHTPYMCQHCPRRFFRMCDLSRHLKASHVDVKL